MRTIERAAEVFETLERTGEKPVEPRPLPVSDAPGQGVTHIEPAHADVKNPAVRLEPIVPSHDWRADDSARQTHEGAIHEILKVDRAHLRRQGVITPDGTRTANTESFRRIKRQILAKAASTAIGMPSNLVLITSALPGEGKTFCAVNLAISMALEMDRTVLLVDADVAKPTVPRTLGVGSGRGLLDVLRDSRLDLSEVLRRTDLGKLTYLPAGSPHAHATELLASEAMRDLLQQIAYRYRDRVVIFDSPPLLAASEAVALAGQVGQIVMVVEAGKTPEVALKSALSRIESSNVTGLLLNKIEAAAHRYQYGEYGKLSQ